MYTKFKPHKGVMAVWFVEKGALAVFIGMLFLLGAVEVVSGLNLEYFQLVEKLFLGIFSLTLMALFGTLAFEYSRKTYYLLPENVHIRHGKKIKRIHLNDVINARVSQNRIEKLFGIGKVHIVTQDKTYKLEGVHSPRQFEINLINKSAKTKLF